MDRLLHYNNLRAMNILRNEFHLFLLVILFVLLNFSIYNFALMIDHFVISDARKGKTFKKKTWETTCLHPLHALITPKIDPFFSFQLSLLNCKNTNRANSIH